MTERPMTSLPRLSASASATEVIDALDRSGCAVVEALVAGQTVDDLLDQLAPYMEATPTGEDEISGALTRRTGAVPARAPASWDMLRHPTILAVAKHYLAPPGQRFHITASPRPPAGPGRSADSSGPVDLRVLPWPG